MCLTYHLVDSNLPKTQVFKSPLLTYACSLGLIGLVSLLMARGADVDAQAEKLDASNMKATTPPLTAINFGSPQIVEMLLGAGADPNNRVDEVQCPFIEALEQDQKVEILRHLIALAAMSTTKGVDISIRSYNVPFCPMMQPQSKRS